MLEHTQTTSNSLLKNSNQSGVWGVLGVCQTGVCLGFSYPLPWNLLKDLQAVWAIIPVNEVMTRGEQFFVFFFVMILSDPLKNVHVPLKGTISKGNFNHHFSGNMLIFRGGTLRICFENIVTYGLYRFSDCKSMSCKHSFVWFCVFVCVAFAIWHLGSCSLLILT